MGINFQGAAKYMEAGNNDIKNEQIITPEDFDAHRLIVVWLFIATLVLVLFTTVALVYSDATGSKTLPTLVVVIIAGVLGSFVSALNRIYASKDIFPKTKYRELLKSANVYLVVYSTIPPLVGCISAAILYVVFAGQIVSGAMFPEFVCKSDAGCDQFELFLSHWSPKGATDYAKAIVWGFVAGFTERLVPDILNKVSADAGK